MAESNRVNIIYDDLRLLTQSWWPESTVGPLRYPKDMSGENLDTVIGKYLQEVSKRNLVRNKYNIKKPY